MDGFSNPKATAWVFPGQGSQTVGMGKALYDKYPQVEELYHTADRLLGYSISGLCFDGPADKLQQTIHAQPALLVTELAHLEALRQRYPGDFETARFVAGHSMGEYTALVAAGMLGFEDALGLVAERGRLMLEAATASSEPLGMAAVIGLSDSELTSICREAGVEIANLNAPEQVVITGRVAGLERATVLAKEKGARRVIPLPLSGAFHSSWMRPMSVAFGKRIRATPFREAQIEIVANMTARPTRDPDEVRVLLQKQTYSPVRWVESVRYMSSGGVETFVEIGPGRVLIGLVKRISPEARTVGSEELLA